MLKHHDTQYLDHMQNIRTHGTYKYDRTGVGCNSLFGLGMRFDISGGKIPLLTTKHVHTKSIIHELIWFLSGDTNIRYLKENGVSIWDSWVIPETAEYRDLTKEEILNKLRVHFGRGVNIAISGKADGVVDGTFVNGGNLYIKVNLDDALFNPENLSSGTLEAEGWKEAYRTTFNDEPRTLIAGDLPHVYGKQWRAWEDIRIVDESLVEGLCEKGFEFKGHLINAEILEGESPSQSVVKRTIDQIAKIVDQLKNNPDSRRIILSAWNVGYIDEMALPPCHTFCQFFSTVRSAGDLLEDFEQLSLLDEWDDYRNVQFDDDPGLIYDFAKEVGVPIRKLTSELYQR